MGAAPINKNEHSSPHVIMINTSREGSISEIGHRNYKERDGFPCTSLPNLKELFGYRNNLIQVIKIKTGPSVQVQENSIKSERNLTPTLNIHTLAANFFH